MIQEPKDIYFFKPHEELIIRDLDHTHEGFLNYLCRPLEEAVNFASQILAWEQKSFGNEEFLGVPLMLLREAADLTDSCAILIQKGSADTPKILARSLFEIFLYMGYLCKADLKMRSYAYLLSSVLDYIKYQESVLQEFAADKVSRKQTLSEVQVSEILGVIEDKKSLFILPGYADAYAYFESESRRRKAKGLRKKLDSWYSYYDGPENLRSLSRELNIEHVYQFFYSKYSKLAHGNEAILGKMVSTGDNRAEMYQLRCFNDVKEVCQYVFLFSTTIIKTYVKTLFPEKTEDLKVFDDWCKNHVRVYQ